MKRFLIKFGKLFIVLFVLANAMSIFHAYHFTHLTNTVYQIPNPSAMTIGQKAKALLMGVSMIKYPSVADSSFYFQTIYLVKNNELEAWLEPKHSNKGTVVFFHGYGGNKQSMQKVARIFSDAGYNTMLVDCRGSGNSKGNTTTIGFQEHEDVQLAFEYLKTHGEENIYMFGSSMGAASIMHAISKDKIEPKAIIVECPFGTMLQSTKNRFVNMHLPENGLSHLLVFWGGAINGFNAYKHNPQDYAKDIHCPTLLIWGSNDERVIPIETKNIFNNLAGKKTLLELHNSGHCDYFKKDSIAWMDGVMKFMQEN